MKPFAEIEVAQSATSYQKLKIDLALTEKYGIAARVELSDGRIRYYGTVKPASAAREMIGARLVREWNFQTNIMRTWYETLDAQNRIRIVRPDPILVGNRKIHYLFNQQGDYDGAF